MIIVIGDIHGHLKYPKAICDRYDLKDSHIIIAGDVGMGFYKEGYYCKEFSYLQKHLSKNNNNLYLIRGNHDDPKYWNNTNLYKFDNSIYNNIHFVEDYSVLELEDKKILCIGGAISVDRCKRDRTKGSMEYWENEVFIYKDLSDEQKSCEYLITHTSSINQYPFAKDGIEEWIKLDPELGPDLLKERRDVDKVIKQMNNLKKHYFGHYHQSYNGQIYGVDYYLLDIEETKEIL